MPLSITTLTNNLDGRTVRAVLDAAPTGTLTFRCKLTADGAVAVKSHALVSGTTYDVTLRPSPEIANVREPWFVAPNDNNGQGAFKGVWLGVTNENELEETTAKVRQIIADNVEFIKLEAKRIYSNFAEEIPVWRGARSLGEDSLKVEVLESGIPNEDYLAAGRYMGVNVACRIIVFVLHNENQTELPLANAIAMGVRNVLNTDPYVRITLVSGNELNDCMVRNLLLQEWVMDEGSGKAGAKAEMTWGGMYAGFRA